jgi:FdhE protein
VADSFLGRWLGRVRSAPPSADEARAELDRLAAERPAVRAPALWLRELLPDLAADERVTAPPLTADQARDKLLGGVPLLRGEPLTFDGKSLRRRWQQTCAALGQHQGDGAAHTEAVRRGRLDLVELAGVVVAGNPGTVAERAAALGLDAGLTTTLLRFTLFPALVALETALAPLRSGVGWERGECPTCGNGPLLGEFRGLDQSRHLRCGWCAADWPVPRLFCPFCGCRDHEQLGFLHREGEETRFRAATCDMCRGCVKMVTTLSALSPLALLVADVATLHLDLAAAERGYGV